MHTAIATVDRELDKDEVGMVGDDLVSHARRPEIGKRACKARLVPEAQPSAACVILPPK